MTTRALAMGSIFETLDTELLEPISRALEHDFVAGGDVLFAQGDPGDALFVVELGRLAVVQRDARGRRHMIREIGRGGVVGELALLTGEPRSATLEAVRDTWLWKLPKASFDQMVESSPQITLALARMIARRAHDRSRPQVPPTATLTLLPSGRGAVDMRAFSERLLAALAPRRPILVDRDHVERVLGADSADATLRLQTDPLGKLLDELEQQHPLVIYLADDDGGVWTGRCIRQADRILRVVSGDDLGLSAAEIRISKQMAQSSMLREELVRVLPDDTSVPSGALAWIESRAVAAHHHVRLGAPADFARLARSVAGRPIGVALSGGGARSVAHIGFLRALGEAGVSIDLIAGTSAGAFVSALFARDDDPDAMVEGALEFARAPFFDPTLPLVSLLAGHRFGRVLRRIFGDAQLEDVWRPCYITSADLVTGQAVVHDRGPLWRAVRASGSLPAVVPPVRWGERLLVDGGVLNNLPADVVRARGVDPLVLASDVSDHATSDWAAGHADAISGWRVLWNRLLGRPTPPSLGEVIVRSSTLAATRHFASIGIEEADLYTRLPVDGFATFEGKNVPKMIEIGHRHARRVIDEWLASGRLTTDGWGAPAVLAR